MILESKLNYMSLAELEMLTPHSGTILMAHLSQSRIELIAEKKAQADYEASKLISDVIGVEIDHETKYWKASRIINGNYRFIRASKNRNVAENAAIEFAKKNNLKIYR